MSWHCADARDGKMVRRANLRCIILLFGFEARRYSLIPERKAMSC